jgi:hypothetical protein
LEEQFPLHVVCDWLGNSRTVAAKHYLQTTDAHFEKALDCFGLDKANTPAQVGMIAAEGLTEDQKTQCFRLLFDLREAKAEAVANDSTLRELVQLWSSLDLSSQQAIITLVRNGNAND